MRIDFAKLEEIRLAHFQGGEKEAIARMVTDERVRIMLGRLEPGASIGLHTHEDSCEVVYVLEGKGIVVCDGVEEKLEAGICHYCPKGHAHTTINNSQEDLVIVAVVPKQ